MGGLQRAPCSQAWIDLYMVCFDSTEQPEQLYVQIAARLQTRSKQLCWTCCLKIECSMDFLHIDVLVVPLRFFHKISGGLMFPIRGGHIHVDQNLILQYFAEISCGCNQAIPLPFFSCPGNGLQGGWQRHRRLQELPRIIDAELISTQPEPEGHGFVWKGKESIRLDSMATRCVWSKKPPSRWGKRCVENDVWGELEPKSLWFWINFDWRLCWRSSGCCNLHWQMDTQWTWSVIYIPYILLYTSRLPQTQSFSHEKLEMLNRFDIRSFCQTLAFYRQAFVGGKCYTCYIQKI